MTPAAEALAPSSRPKCHATVRTAGRRSPPSPADIIPGVSSDNKDPLSGPDPLADGPWSQAPAPEFASAPPAPEFTLAPPAPTGVPTAPWEESADTPQDASPHRARGPQDASTDVHDGRGPQVGRQRSIRVRVSARTTNVRVQVGHHPTSGGCVLDGLTVLVMCAAVLMTIVYIGMFVTRDLSFAKSLRATACVVAALWLCNPTLVPQRRMSRVSRVLRLIAGTLLVLGSFIVSAF